MILRFSYYLYVYMHALDLSYTLESSDRIKGLYTFLYECSLGGAASVAGYKPAVIVRDFVEKQAYIYIE